MLPEGIVTTGWPSVEAKGRELGFTFDPWQVGAGRVALGKRADGKYACTVGGITWSIPRQVGKTYLVGSLLLILCILFPGLKVLWTAHRTRTSTNTFKSMQGMCRRKKVAPHVLAIRTTNGEQEIVFRNGSTIMFGARENGFGRGFDVVDVEVFDEAQILTEKALEDMVPATNQAKHPHGALLFFIGTPPRPVDPGEVFTNRRARALEGKSPDGFYLELSAEEDADPDDRAQWAVANPSYPVRTPLESMLRMRENLGSDEAWRREALGIWDSDGKPSLISRPVWRALKLAVPPADGRVSYGVKFAIDGSTVALAAALRPADGPVHVEVVEHRSMSAGTGWLVEWLVERHALAAQIVVDGKSGAGALVNALRARKVSARVLIAPTSDQVISAHAMLLEAVKGKALSHFDQPALNESVASADKRAIGRAGGWGWTSINGGDVTPIDAVTLAHWAAMTSKRRPGRKQVML